MTIKKTSESSVVSSGVKVSSAVVGSTGSTVIATGSSTAAARPPDGFEKALQEMLQGFQEFLPTGFVLPSASGGFSQATVVAQLESMLALYPAVVTARQATSQAVANLRAAVPATHALMKALKLALIGFYQPGNPALAKFGIASKPRATPSSLQNAVKAAKAVRTRQTNGTLGKQQKAKLALAAEVQSVLVPQGTATAQSEAPAVPAKPMTSGQ